MRLADEYSFQHGSIQATVQSLAGERCCLAATALRGEHAINDANVNAHAGRNAHG